MFRLNVEVIGYGWYAGQVIKDYPTILMLNTVLIWVRDALCFIDNHIILLNFFLISQSVGTLFLTLSTVSHSLFH